MAGSTCTPFAETGAETLAPGSGFICDLNGKIEYVVSKRVAWSPSKNKLRYEPISILLERIEGVA